MTRPLTLIIALVLIGAGWGLTTPLGVIAVSEGYGPAGLLFWEMVIAVVILGGVMLKQGRPVPTGQALWLGLFVAFSGTLIPGTAFFVSAARLPGGVLSILISTVPMCAFAIALMMRLDRFSALRLGGLALGLMGVLLMVAPEASLPERAMVAFIPVALIMPLCYGLEGNVLAKYGGADMDPVGLLFVASCFGALVILPVALLTGQFISPLPPYGLPDAALLASGTIHAIVYTGYVWLVGRAGSVFAAQVAYLVTGFGVVWSMVLLGERYSGYIWLALVVMLAGIFLVQPRRSNALVPPQGIGNDAP